jgi:predicted TPR repeat methyltransferase
MTDSKIALKMSDAYASKYDESVGAKHWHAPEVLFGLMYEYLEEGQRLLDVGIGTGMSARFFYRAGLQIYGVDGSEEMLKICKKKKITEGLAKLDLTLPAEPFPGKKFDHIISNGVFHIVGDLELVFKTIDLKIKPGGIIGFTVDDKVINEKDDYRESEIEGIYYKKHVQSDYLYTSIVKNIY